MFIFYYMINWDFGFFVVEDSKFRRVLLIILSLLFSSKKRSFRMMVCKNMGWLADHAHIFNFVTKNNFQMYSVETSELKICSKSGLVWFVSIHCKWDPTSFFFFVIFRQSFYHFGLHFNLTEIQQFVDHLALIWRIFCWRKTTSTSL